MLMTLTSLPKLFLRRPGEYITSQLKKKLMVNNKKLCSLVFNCTFKMILIGKTQRNMTVLCKLCFKFSHVPTFPEKYLNLLISA